MVLNRYIWQKVIYSKRCKMGLLISCVLHTPDRTVLFTAVHKNTKPSFSAAFQQHYTAADALSMTRRTKKRNRGCIIILWSDLLRLL